MSKYFDTFIEVNSVPTHVLQYGLKEPITAQNKVKEEVLVLMISGNPGEVEYYKDFMSQINVSTQLAVVGVSHAGHNVVPKHLTIPPINENPDLYSLNGQIVHKKSFIEEYISEKSKLVLIGHSIGSYIIIELLHRYPHIKSRVLHSVLVFPTIDKLSDTPEGYKYGILFGWFKYPLLWLSHLINYMLSDNSKFKMVSYFVGTQYNNSPECALKSATNLMNPKCLEALIYMSLIEFKTVELNREAIDSNEKSITYLYGEADLWCPIDRVQRIRGLFPNCDIRLCLDDMKHAFVLLKDQTLKISQMVVPIIQSVLQSL